MRLFPVAVTLALVSSLTACVSTAVRQENRDQTGKFDGQWTLNYVMTKGEIRSGLYEFRCNEDKGSLELRIKDGEISGDLVSEQPTYVDQSGHIYFVSATTSGGFSMDDPGSYDSGSRILMNIDLQQTTGTGKMVFALGRGNAGCPGTLTLTKHGS
ncbi:hypothetical protein C4K68_26305 [Pokkaliibacter plantistimulans]|uniref:Lipocalin-like domain-containing protein n=1 Tax=Proteobacteria bacterium 228 TaxID=2083153 RepID=A0A2S5KI34_9PROT|nr:hypothetical protein [Pokkaliibacter plantistimulans]PPC74448.1 hypothetical protein C4K68_26305 [Pokkaliibacter plantistimulans]